MNNFINEQWFLEDNKLNDNKIEYVYYDEICIKFKDIDFSNFKFIIDNIEVIKVSDVRKCLLQFDESYRNFTAEIILNEIDKYGYYGTDEFNYHLEEITELIDSDILMDNVDKQTWESINYIAEKTYEKCKDKIKKSRRDKKLEIR